MIKIGDVYRDTYGIKRGYENKRTIRIVAQEPDGRWLVETLTGTDGLPLTKSRRSRIGDMTLATGYAPIKGK
jgi:hypothetical protein